ncbi:MAG: hypothetical protein KDJ86_02900 [Bauldia sp.]|uniref:O-antigen ligase family protein n=1 Tax=Bauldia sp. TaxID=2575872 RepID=UPI001D4D6F3A|nr:hypothetical protein [Bauldia sp.]MCB1494710.1 hypothetical protein [Bauldia sp.]
MTIFYDETVGEAPRERLVLRVWGPVTLLFVASAFHTLAFRFTPDAFGHAVAGLVGLALMLAALLPAISDGRLEFDARKIYFLVMVVATMGAYFFQVAHYASAVEFATNLIRVQTAIAAVIFFSTTDGSLSVRPALLAYAAMVLLAFLMTAKYGLYEYGGTARPYPFTGEETVHPSGYALMAALIGTIILKMRGAIGWRMALLIGVPVAGLILAYQVRTTWMMIIAFVVVLALFSIRRRLGPRVFAASLGAGFALVMLVIGLVMAFGLGGFDLSQFSSGRTSVYLERIDLIVHRPVAEVLFGTGIGSDSLRTATWWWAEKDSHNDFLRIVIEQGVVCLAALILILGATLRRLRDPVRIAVMAALVTGSFLSNGLLDRPLLAVMFLATMAFSAVPDKNFVSEGRWVPEEG